MLPSNDSSPFTTITSPSTPDTGSQEFKRSFLSQALQGHLQTHKRTLLITCMTWNVNGREPPSNLSTVLPQSNTDILVISLQEVDYIRAETVLYDNENQSIKWLNAITETANVLNLNLTPLHHRTLVGIQLIVMIKEDLLPFVHDAGSGTVSTGVMNMLGNKGAVIVEFCLWNAWIKLVAVHLAAHLEQTLRRNVEIGMIQGYACHWHPFTFPLPAILALCRDIKDTDILISWNCCHAQTTLRFGPVTSIIVAPPIP